MYGDAGTVINANPAVLIALKKLQMFFYFFFVAHRVVFLIARQYLIVTPVSRYGLYHQIIVKHSEILG